MTTGQRLAEFDMDSTEEDREDWERIAVVIAITVAALAGLLIHAGPLLY